MEAELQGERRKPRCWLHRLELTSRWRCCGPEPSTEQQDRLTGLVNVLGFTSLDHLEDFVVLHGAARVVPAASIAAAGASLPLDDTQTQTNTLYSATRHAQRNDERRRENRRLRSEVDEVRKELDWLRREHEKHVDELERLRKDKRKLMDEVDSAKAAAAAGPTATATACARTDDAYFEQGIAALVTEAPALYDQIEELEQLLVELEEENTGLVHENHTLEGEKCALETENHAAWSSYDDATATLEQLQQRCDRAEAEMERLKLVEAEFDNLKTQIGTLSAIAARASPAPPQRASSRQPTDPSAIRRNHP
ncbi:uncharacterized protein JCM15063_002387 [Sporobolomyces koalae]|uniref:uncharacterized protein n=1 Tax=Sporobolomyces koalae TaxID=500713 RepID=UPI003177D306